MSEWVDIPLPPTPAQRRRRRTRKYVHFVLGPLALLGVVVVMVLLNHVISGPTKQEREFEKQLASADQLLTIGESFQIGISGDAYRTADIKATHLVDIDRGMWGPRLYVPQEGHRLFLYKVPTPNVVRFGWWLDGTPMCDTKIDADSFAALGEVRGLNHEWRLLVADETARQGLSTWVDLHASSTTSERVRELIDDVLTHDLSDAQAGQVLELVREYPEALNDESKAFISDLLNRKRPLHAINADVSPAGAVNKLGLERLDPSSPTFDLGREHAAEVVITLGEDIAAVKEAVQIIESRSDQSGLMLGGVERTAPRELIAHLLATHPEYIDRLDTLNLTMRHLRDESVHFARRHPKLEFDAFIKLVDLITDAGGAISEVNEPRHSRFFKSHPEELVAYIQKRVIDEEGNSTNWDRSTYGPVNHFFERYIDVNVLDSDTPTDDIRRLKASLKSQMFRDRVTHALGTKPKHQELFLRMMIEDLKLSPDEVKALRESVSPRTRRRLAEIVTHRVLQTEEEADALINLLSVNTRFGEEAIWWTLSSGNRFWGVKEFLVRLPPESTERLLLRLIDRKVEIDQEAVRGAAFAHRELVPLDAKLSDVKDWSPVQYWAIVAVRNRDKADLELLLDLGAKPNSGYAPRFGDDPGLVTERNLSLLGLAIKTKQLDVAQLLIDHGGTVSSPHYSEDVVRDEETLKLLLDNGLSPDSIVGDFIPMLNVAVLDGNEDAVRRLLEAGADPVSSDRRTGKKILQLVDREAHPAIYDMLEEKIKERRAQRRRR